jgi:hypothetical protein
MILKTRIMILIVVLLGSTQSRAEECTAIMSGNWSDPAIWSCGFQPGCGDLVIIPSGLTVNVNVMVDLDEPGCLNPTYIQISGTLQFITGFKINLACGSGVEIMPGGQMLPGGGGGSSNWLEICGETEWRTSDGPQSGYKFYGVPAPLSLEFISMTVGVENKILVIDWVVSDEKGNSHFDIEFSSDGKHWEVLASIASIGDHMENIKYSFDTETSFSNGYVRLFASDVQGKRVLLATKSFASEILQLLVYPNPVEKGRDVYLELPTGLGSILDVKVCNQIGQLMKSFQMTMNSSHTGVWISTEAFINGLHFIEVVSTDGEVFRERIVVR